MATSDDWSAIARLLTESELPLDGAEEALAGCLLACDAGETLLGCAALERYGAHMALLRSVAVTRTARGQGVGMALVAKLLADARQDGVTEIWLLTTTAADYFPRFGFQAVKRESAPSVLQNSAEFRYACPASAIVMRRITEKSGPEKQPRVR